MVKLLVNSGAQIDIKGKVSTEPFMVLRRDSSLTISISSPLTLSHPSPLSLLSPMDLASVIASLFCSNFSVKGLEVVGMCA